MFGQCSDVSFITFMSDKRTTQCSFAKQPMSLNFCTDTLDIGNILNINMYKNGDKASDPIPVEIDNVVKYDGFNLDKTATEAVLKAVKTPTYNAADGTCDNFALEVHLKIVFQPVAGSKETSFEITKIKADMVYGKIKPASLTQPVSISRKTSLRFIESDNSRSNSGAPGYIKSLPLLTGELI